MSTVAMLLSAASSFALLASGYLYGARRGRRARLALAEAHAAQEKSFVELELQVARNGVAARDKAAIRTELEAVIQPLLSSSKSADVDGLRHELRSMMRTLSEQERTQDALRDELRQGLAGLAKQSTEPDRLKQDIQKLVAPLLRKQDDAAALRAMMNDVLRPIVERDRLGKELSAVEEGDGLRELPRMLDAIAEKGSFSTVVLSDDVGLPLAANTTGVNVDTLAGMASLLLTLVERAERSDTPSPLAFVVHDASNQHVIHRIFRVGAQRFTLTAVSRGMHVSPGALDAALSKLEKAIGAPRA